MDSAKAAHDNADQRLDFKDDGDLWIEGWDVIAGEICTRIEDETITRRLRSRFRRAPESESRPSAICRSFAEQNPAARGFHFKSNRYARSGPAACGIKDVCSGWRSWIKQFLQSQTRNLSLLLTGDAQFGLLVVIDPGYLELPASHQAICRWRKQ